MAGKICLLKYVISALPLFYLSFFKAPTAVCNRIRYKLSFFGVGGMRGERLRW